MAELPIGSIIAYGGEMPHPLARQLVWEAKNGWYLCDGRSLEQGDYLDLFNAIGFAWGGYTDDKGIKWFNLPDLRGYFLRGVDASGDNAMDPDIEERFARHPNGNVKGRVGSFQRWATARPLASLPGSPTQTHFWITTNGSAHKHSLRFQLNAGRDAGKQDNTVAFPGVHDPQGTDAPFDVQHGGDGEHTHGIAGGNLETRPVNAYVHWIIRAA
jgi:microcystin-dependent protein